MQQFLEKESLEIVNQVYFLWPQYMKLSYKNRPTIYPHKNIYELLYSIQSNLEHLNKMSIQQIKKFRVLHHISYPYFNLLCFLPLLEDGCQMMETILAKQTYSDADEYIYIAFSKFNPIEFFGFLQRILKNNHLPKPGFNKPSIDLYGLEELRKLYKSHNLILSFGK